MGVLLVLANVVWAYSASLIKTVKMKDSCEMNYHLAIIIIISTGIHYSLFGIELKSLDLYVGAIFYSAIPIGIGQVLFVTSLTLSRNTGTLTLFVSVSIIVGYCFSLIRYHENLNPIAVIGSLMIISGLAIVVLCKEKIENRIQKL
jgi:drug/metabolite transporter (DMT)-like permease